MFATFQGKEKNAKLQGSESCKVHLFKSCVYFALTGMLQVKIIFVACCNHAETSQAADIDLAIDG